MLNQKWHCPMSYSLCLNLYQQCYCPKLCRVMFPFWYEFNELSCYLDALEIFKSIDIATQCAKHGAGPHRTWGYYTNSKKRYIIHSAYLLVELISVHKWITYRYYNSVRMWFGSSDEKSNMFSLRIGKEWFYVDFRRKPDVKPRCYNWLSSETQSRSRQSSRCGQCLPGRKVNRKAGEDIIPECQLKS